LTHAISKAEKFSNFYRSGHSRNDLKGLDFFGRKISSSHHHRITASDELALHQKSSGQRQLRKLI